MKWVVLFREDPTALFTEPVDGIVATTRRDALALAFDPSLSDPMTVAEFNALQAKDHTTAGWAGIEHGRWAIKPVDT